MFLFFSPGLWGLIRQTSQPVSCKNNKGGQVLAVCPRAIVGPAIPNSTNDVINYS